MSNYTDDYLGFVSAAADLYEDAFDVLLAKQRDYGPDNIRLAPFGELNGLLVRTSDKLRRAVNLVKSGATPENESLRDTFLDLMNYGAIGVLLIDGTFPAAGTVAMQDASQPVRRVLPVDDEDLLDCQCDECAELPFSERYLITGAEFETMPDLDRAFFNGDISKQEYFYTKIKGSNA